MQRSHDRCKGRGGEPTVIRPLGGGGGGGGGEGLRKGRGGTCGEEEGWPAMPTTLGSSGPSLWARRARHSGLVGPVKPATLGPSGLPPGPVRPAQYKARGLAAGLKKKKKFWPGPAC